MNAHGHSTSSVCSQVWINCYDNFDMACPFGGTKESGWGREKGEYALENYTTVKVVMTPIGISK